MDAGVKATLFSNPSDLDEPAGMTDCADVHSYDLYAPGIYQIDDPQGLGDPVNVQCHDGWTVILARGQVGQEVSGVMRTFFV